MTTSSTTTHLLRSTPADLDEIFRLYQLASAYQIAVKGTVIWPEFARDMVAQEVAEGRQWKLVVGDTIACVWAITFDDPEIWGPRNADPAVYIHRIATNPTCRGQGFVATIVAWAKEYARQHQKQFVRLDTVGENHGLIAHYTKCGFTYLGLTELTDTASLPAHYHGATVSLFELTVEAEKQRSRGSETGSNAMLEPLVTVEFLTSNKRACLLQNSAVHRRAPLQRR